METIKRRARNRRGEGSKLRQDILDAATELLDTGGEVAVTLRDIARKVNIASPSIYAHFPDRETIVAALVQVTFAELKHALEAALEATGEVPVARLRALGTAYLDFADRRPQRYRILFGGLWQGPSSRRAPIEAAEPGGGDDVFMLLVGVLQACQAAGQCEGTDPFTDAAGVWVALHGLAELRAAAPRFPWPEAILTTLLERLALIKLDEP